MSVQIQTIRDDIDCLVPLISFLGANPYWWARSPQSLAKELSLDAERVAETLERYPMIFRKSAYDEMEGQYYYALQMRYAQRKDGRIDEPPRVSALPVLSEDEILHLIDFLVKLSSMENTLEASRRTSRTALLAAMVSAIAALVAAISVAWIRVGGLP